MGNAFAGIPDLKTDEAARIYDLKGSGRECNFDSHGKACGVQYDYKEKDFDKNMGKLGFFAGYFAKGNDPGYGKTFYTNWGDFVDSIARDVALLKKLKIHDYSLVMRITPTASADCPQGFQRDKWWKSVDQWGKAPTWRGAGTEMCAMLDRDDSRSVRISAVLLDYLQLSTTVANQLASVAPGSKTWSNDYADRFRDFIETRFYPFFVVEISSKANYGYHPGDEWDVPEHHYKFCKFPGSLDSQKPSADHPIRGLALRRELRSGLQRNGDQMLRVTLDSFSAYQRQCRLGNLPMSDQMTLDPPPERDVEDLHQQMII